MICPTRSGLLVIMLDGATDDKVPALDYKTPLQVSSMKFINSVASSGELGCTDAREYTHFFLLQLFSGKPLDVPRGVIEAFGLGLPLGADRIAYRMTPARSPTAGSNGTTRSPAPTR